jgi:Protein of unknown function (DUF3551)
MARQLLASHLVFRAKTRHREKQREKMKKFLTLAAAPATALCAIAFMTMATPAAQAGEYCGTNSSGMRGCGFSTMEQCKASMSGQNGTCDRDPFLPAASNSASNGTSSNNALAYQPKHAGSKRHAKTAVSNR